MLRRHVVQRRSEEARAMRTHYGVSRREVLSMAVAAGGVAMSGALGSVFAQALKRTPGELLRPFFPVRRSVEKAADLTTIRAKPGRRAGQVTYVSSRVVT